MPKKKTQKKSKKQNVKVRGKKNNVNQNNINIKIGDKNKPQQSQPSYTGGTSFGYPVYTQSPLMQQVAPAKPTFGEAAPVVTTPLSEPVSVKPLSEPVSVKPLSEPVSVNKVYTKPDYITIPDDISTLTNNDSRYMLENEGNSYNDYIVPQNSVNSFSSPHQDIESRLASSLYSPPTYVSSVKTHSEYSLSTQPESTYIGSDSSRSSGSKQSASAPVHVEAFTAPHKDIESTISSIAQSVKGEKLISNEEEDFANAQPKIPQKGKFNPDEGANALREIRNDRNTKFNSIKAQRDVLEKLYVQKTGLEPPSTRNLLINALRNEYKQAPLTK